MIDRESQDFEFDTAVAIIGMAGRFPGANTLDQFWRNMTQGVQSIRFFSDEELLAAGVDPDLMSQPEYVKAGTVIDNIDSFDSAFFGFTPREAELMDPQLRLFLECSWEAFEDAAYSPETYQGLVGVFAGSAISTYMLNNIFNNAEVFRKAGMLQVGVLNSSDSLSTWVSYKLNFRGPSVVVQTFCSTSLVAVHMACQSLLNYECDMALAGGVAISVPHGTGYVYQEGGIVSPDGQCRTFDADGQGSVMSNGAGVVALKRLDQAVADGDHVYAVIRGSAVNNDGIRKVGYTAPGLEGQSSVIAEALAHAGVDPATVGYLEAHGTATALGDSIELAATIKAYKQQTDQTQYCALGSVKPNVGHLDRAAGVTGLIKTVLALKHREIPPSLNFEQASPEIDLSNSPFFVNTALRPWETDGRTPRRAGVSSFGLGGTNAHVVLQETPLEAPSGQSYPQQLLLLSAKTDSALQTMAANLASFLRAYPEVDLADVAHTLQVGRTAFNHRRALVARDRDDAIAQLEAAGVRGLTANQTDRDRSVAFLFPGVGDHYAGMAADLYTHEARFRVVVDECCTLLNPLLDQDLLAVLYPESGRGNGAPAAGLDFRQLLAGLPAGTPAGTLHQTALAQPAVFVVEYALVQLLASWGIRPQALLGYSLGEYVAATVAGVLSLEDALRLVALRARLIQNLPAGSMLAVSLGEDDARRYVRGDVALAAVNSPSASILAGPAAALEAVARQCAADEVACRWLETSHAFHSAMLEPARAALTDLTCSLTLNPPAIPYVSNVTGTWITVEEATDPDYWARHMCQTVRFAAGAGALLEGEPALILEVGPGQALASFVKQHSACSRERMGQILSVLPTSHGRQAELAHVLETLGRLWLAGVNIDWAAFSAGEQRRRLSLPTYPFERQRYWVDADAHGKSGSSLANDEFLNSADRIADVGDWFFVPSWKRTSPPSPILGAPLFADQHTWLLLVDDSGLGLVLAERLKQHGQTVVTIAPGAAFAATDPASYTVRPAEREDYISVIKKLAREGIEPSRVLHLWLASPAELADESPTEVDSILERGFYSLLALTQALGNQGVERCEVNVVTTGVHAVVGQEAVNATKSTVIGPCKIIPQEHPNLTARSIDVIWAPDRQGCEELVDRLVVELASTPTGAVIALRGQHRWVQAYEQIHLPEFSHPHARLRDQGVYVITGGLGGIGLALAEYLVASVRAKVVLIGRTALPSRERWDDIIAAEGTESGTGHRVHCLRQLEAGGAEVLVLQADVADAGQIAAAIDQAVARFGAINGVFHAAGVPGVGLMQLKTAEAAASVLAPKVQGTLAIAQAVRSLPLDFLVLFSSVAAAAGGGQGQADYCAANIFLDSYAQLHHRDHGVTISIGWGEWHWDAWSEGLQGFTEEVRAFFIASRRTFGIDFADGMEALRRILAYDLPQIFVSPRDLTFLVEASQRSFAAFLKMREDREQSRYPRPALAVAYAAPRNDLETRIAAIWSDVLGIDLIGIDDNFFDLGGNSLLGLDLFGRMRKALKLDNFPAYVLYESPTVELQAAHITNLQQPAIAHDDGDEHEDEQRRMQLNYFVDLDEMGDL
ncbi:MAG: SDR family NAD(P)-dependent oxidoreductase [Chloroflexi bacterium]|nr:SDR family NAD(P)-dependent oxidoreductase [Chloroflexota bacterium]